MFGYNNDEEKDIDLDEKLDNQQKKTMSEQNSPKSIDMDTFFKGRVGSSPGQITFKTFVDGFNDGDYILPKYQRKYVWNKEAINQLVISLIRGIPIPPIYAYCNENGDYVILDGQQRCLSLFLYWCGLVPKQYEEVNFYDIIKNMQDGNSLKEILLKQYTGKNKPFQKVENSKYKGYFGEKFDLTYSRLEPKYIKDLGKRTINFVFIVAKGDNKQMLYANMFRLLNAGGSPLSDQEIRNGSFACNFYDILYDTNKFLHKIFVWKNLYTKKLNRARDMERLLRIISLEKYTKLEKNNIEFIKDASDICLYKSNIPKLLDDFSQESINFSEEEVTNIATNIKEFFHILDKYGHKNVRQAILETLYSIYIKSGKNEKCLEIEFLCYVKKQIVNVDNILLEKEDDYKIDKDKFLIELTYNKEKLENRFTFVYRCFKNYILKD